MLSIKEFYQEKEYQKAIDLFNSLPALQHTADDEMFCGLAHFQLYQFKDATRIFEVLAKKQPQVANYFNWATGLVMNKEFARANEVFKSLVELYNEQGAELSLLFYELNFTRALVSEGATALAMSYMNGMKEKFLKYEDGDVHFMYVRGIPSFPEYLHLVDMYVKAAGKELGSEYIKELANSVNSDNRLQLGNLYLELTGESLPEPTLFPPGEESSEGGCLYVLVWFFLAGALLAITYLRFFK